MAFLGPPTIGMKQLAHLSRRLAIALDAGLDARSVLQREANAGPAVQKRKLREVSEAIKLGESLPDALDQAGHYFPRLFRDMVRLGDETGSMDRVLLKLSEHYDHLINVRRGFLLGILFPVIYLLIALGVIGLLILALGWVGSMTGETTDVLGFGLTGVPGLIRYTSFLSLVAAAMYGVYRLTRLRIVGSSVQQLLARLPWVGEKVQVMALARMAWTLALAHDAGADARKTVRLALASTQSDYYRGFTEQIDRSIRSGKQMHESLASTGAFPQLFVHTIAVGEESGRLSESLEKLAEQYQAQAKAAMVGLAVLATLAVWGGVAMIIIYFIFRLASFYLGILDEATQGF